MDASSRRAATVVAAGIGSPNPPPTGCRRAQERLNRVPLLGFRLTAAAGTDAGHNVLTCESTNQSGLVAAVQFSTLTLVDRR